MPARRIYRESLLGVTLVAVGCPDDGREYVEIEPTTPVKGMRVVWYSPDSHAHRWGYIVSEWPQAGEHIDRTWSLNERAAYWVAVVADAEMPDFLRAESHEARMEATVFVPIGSAWLAPPEGIPAQRSG